MSDEPSEPDVYESDPESSTKPEEPPKRKRYASTKGADDKRRTQCLLNLDKARAAKTAKANIRKEAEAKAKAIKQEARDIKAKAKAKKVLQLPSESESESESEEEEEIILTKRTKRSKQSKPSKSVAVDTTQADRMTRLEELMLRLNNHPSASEPDKPKPKPKPVEPVLPPGLATTRRRLFADL